MCVRLSLMALTCMIEANVLAFLLFLGFIKQILLPFYEIVTFKKVPPVVRTNDSLFNRLPDLGYPFKPHYITLKIQEGATLPRVHFVDEGRRDAKEVILCLHGEPSWSFLYRKMVPVLVSAGYRVVVPDFIGFGKSDKFTSMDLYTHDMHTTTLQLLIQELELNKITLVCQDWGGLTGLAVVKEMPSRFSRLVVMNTGLPTGWGCLLTFRICYDLELISRSLAFLIWQAIVKLLGTWIPIYFLFHWIVGFSKDVSEGYAMPFPSALYKAGVAKWPLLVLTKLVNKSMRDTRNFLKTWKKPALVMFSDNDPITRGEEKFFMNTIPQAKKVTIHGAGHFLQEECGGEIADNIVWFITNDN